MKVSIGTLGLAVVIAIMVTTIVTEATREPERIVEVVYIQTPTQQEQKPPEGIQEPEQVFPMETLGVYEVTAYCSCEICTGKSDGITYSGTQAVEGITIAADLDRHPLGTELFIEGVGWRTVQDKGGAIKGNKLDVFFSQHSDALNFGRQQLEIFKEVQR